LLVIVGSTNPVKVSAAENIFCQWRLHAEVKGMDVDSGVAEQPMSDEDTIQGAVNRAKNALKENRDALFGVGIEGGVTETPDGLYLCNWGACVRRDGIIGIGGGARFLLPNQVKERIYRGEELGQIIDEFMMRKGTSRKEGAVGFFSHGILNRRQMLEQVVIVSLMRFIEEDLYTI
jgi:inosine/xanthosine triphosphatase